LIVSTRGAGAVYALDLLLERLPDALVDEGARKDVRLIGDQLTDTLSSSVGLAARLGDDNAIDVLLRAVTERQLAALASLEHPGWQGVARLAERSRHLIRYRDPVPGPIWLEFDAGTDRVASLPAPNVFTAAAPEPGDRRAPGWDIAGTVAEVLATVSTTGPARGLIAQLDRVVASGLTVRQVGAAADGPGDTVRLCCAFDTAGAEAARLLDALGRCGWSGPADALAHWTGICAEWADLLHVSLDVTAAGVRPEVAIEVSQVGAPQPHHDPRWAGLLDVLRAAGLCTRAKRDAVCCLGQEYETELFGRHSYRQELHHVKLTVGGDARVEARAYFGAYELSAPAAAPVALLAPALLAPLA
jgi:hypothetical protein